MSRSLLLISMFIGMVPTKMGSNSAMFAKTFCSVSIYKPVPVFDFHFLNILF